MPGVNRLFIGTAGWSLPRAQWSAFPEEGTHLHRYGAVLDAAEINSSFYRPHRVTLYEKWAASTPPDFRFSVKVPKRITHTERLVGCDGLVSEFLEQVRGLGNRLGCLLMQLPPSFAFERRVLDTFLTGLRAQYDGPLALEPRHVSWSAREPHDVLRHHAVARVAADPVLFPGGGEPDVHAGLVYYRLHGSPRVYWSEYSADALTAVASRLVAVTDADVWCIFDNTASGSALPNALDAMTRVQALRQDALRQDALR